MVQFVGDGGRFDEEFVRSVGHPRTHPGRIDHGVNENIGDVDAERSHFTACTSGSSCARRLVSSAERASAMIRNPPAEKRLTMAAPVPGPTPVTIATGFSVI